MERLERVLQMNQQNGNTAKSTADSEAHKALTEAHRAARARMVSFRKASVDEAVGESEHDLFDELPGPTRNPTGATDEVPLSRPCGDAANAAAGGEGSRPRSPSRDGEGQPCPLSAASPSQPQLPEAATAPLDATGGATPPKMPLRAVLKRSTTCSELPTRGGREYRTGSLNPMGPGIVGKHSILPTLAPEHSPGMVRSFDARRRRRSSDFSLPKPGAAAGQAEAGLSTLGQLEYGGQIELGGASSGTAKSRQESMDEPALPVAATPNLMQAFMRQVVGGGAASSFAGPRRISSELRGVCDA